jgi:hypothetical protein
MAGSGLSVSEKVGRRMSALRIAALVYAVISGVVVAFQCALAAGVPWGQYAMGGAYPGTFPTALRVAAVVQAAIIVLQVGVVAARAGLALESWNRSARWLIWLVVGLGLIALVLNLITPSGGERAIWAPVALLLFGSSLTVALLSGRRDAGYPTGSSPKAR